VPWRNSSSSRMLPIIDGIAIHRNGAYGVVVLALWLLHGRLAAGSGWRARRQRVAGCGDTTGAACACAVGSGRPATGDLGDANNEQRRDETGEMGWGIAWGGARRGLDQSHTHTKEGLAAGGQLCLLSAAAATNLLDEQLRA